jgi:hypothetical protein
MRKLVFAIAVALATALCAGATAVAQSPPKVKIAETTVPLDAFGAALLTVRYRCEPLPEGFVADIRAHIAQPAFPHPTEGEVPSGNGGKSVECTGRWETTVVLVSEDTGDPLPHSCRARPSCLRSSKYLTAPRMSTRARARSSSNAAGGAGGAAALPPSETEWSASIHEGAQRIRTPS